MTSLEDVIPSERSNVSQYEIAVLVGSLRRQYFNRKLARALAKLAPPGFIFNEVAIGDLPPYNQDDDAMRRHPCCV